MKIKTLIFSSLVVLPLATALAEVHNVGTCGWGSKLMEGNSGVAPQALAVTTNGTSGNQTFGITSGTSGCTQDGVVKSSWKMSLFIDNNLNKLAHDLSRGSGESIDSLANLFEMNKADKDLFAQVARNNFNNIFPDTEVNSKSVIAGLKVALESNSQLSKYSAMI